MLLIIPGTLRWLQREYSYLILLLYAFIITEKQIK